jgi:hypothetical protein
VIDLHAAPGGEYKHPQLGTDLNLADQLQGQNIGWHSDNGSSIASCAYTCSLVFSEGPC